MAIITSFGHTKFGDWSLTLKIPKDFLVDETIAPVFASVLEKLISSLKLAINEEYTELQV